MGMPTTAGACALAQTKSRGNSALVQKVSVAVTREDQESYDYSFKKQGSSFLEKQTCRYVLRYRWKRL